MVTRLRKNEVDVNIPAIFQPFLKPCRYKVAFGGRGASKSWNIARIVILKAVERPRRILCAREFQTSMSDSVHKLLCDQIDAMGLTQYFTITKKSIVCSNGSEFIFKGLRRDVAEIKSTEGIDICWIEEAQAVSEASWEVLIPTIRKEGSEIWLSFNPLAADDPTYKRFVLSPPPGAVVLKVSWRDNPYFPDVLREEMENTRRTDPAAYAHVWEGEVKQISDAVIFKGKYTIQAFDTPEDVRFYHGNDWGFAQDPTTLLRCFIQDRCLYVDSEVWGVGVELDEIPAFFDAIPTARKWPIKSDGARPETISYVRRRGFNISAAKKWQGSVEDGIEFLRSFDQIIVHPRCKHTAEELSRYSYKVDKQTGDILPVIVDADNHCIDALRYALDGLIKGRSGLKFNPVNLRGVRKK